MKFAELVCKYDWSEIRPSIVRGYTQGNEGHPVTLLHFITYSQGSSIECYHY